MSKIAVKYEICVPAGLNIESVVFGNKTIDLLKDQDPSNPGLFKNTNAYTCYPSGDKLKIRIFANGREGFSWKLKIWINDKLKTDPVIQIAANTLGRADYNEKVNWN